MRRSCLRSAARVRWRASQVSCRVGRESRQSYSPLVYVRARARRTSGLGAGYRLHRKDTDDNRHDGILAQLETNLAVSDKRRQKVRLAAGKADEHSALRHANRADLVEVAVQ